MGASAFVRLDVDWSGRLVVANASLWPLGVRAQRMVLDPGTHLGQRVGILGVRDRLRELVSAWLRRPSGLRVLCFRVGVRHAIQDGTGFRLARMDRDVPQAVRRAWRLYSAPRDRPAQDRLEHAVHRAGTRSRRIAASQIEQHRDFRRRIGGCCGTASRWQSTGRSFPCPRSAIRANRDATPDRATGRLPTRRCGDDAARGNAARGNATRARDAARETARTDGRGRTSQTSSGDAGALATTGKWLSPTAGRLPTSVDRLST